MKAIYATLLATSFFCIQNVQATPTQHEEKGFFGTMGDFILDCIVGGYGCGNLKRENEVFVRDIAYELRLKNPDKIYIRRLGQEAIRHGLWDFGSLWTTFKDRTAMAFHVIGFARCIFIDEKTFEKLSVDEKRFVVGRELMRIKEDHAIKIRGMGLILTLLGGAPTFAMTYFIRLNDKEADIESARCLNAAKGGLMYYNMMSRYKRVCRDDLRPWLPMKLYRKCLKILNPILNTRHPFRKKKAYMRELCI